jgi:hypothetical protein
MDFRAFLAPSLGAEHHEGTTSMPTTGDPDTTERAQQAEAWQGLAVDAVLLCRRHDAMV